MLLRSWKPRNHARTGSKLMVSWSRPRRQRSQGAAITQQSWVDCTPPSPPQTSIVLMCSTSKVPSCVFRKRVSRGEARVAPATTCDTMCCVSRCELKKTRAECARRGVKYAVECVSRTFCLEKETVVKTECRLSWRELPSTRSCDTGTGCSARVIWRGGGQTEQGDPGLLCFRLRDVALCACKHANVDGRPAVVRVCEI